MKDYSQLSRISLEVQHDYNVDVGRIERASRIVANHEVRQITSIRYAVKSQSKSAEYLVNLDTLQCGCQDAKRDHVCKHVLSSLILRALPERNMTLDELIAQATMKIDAPVQSGWGMK